MVDTDYKFYMSRELINPSSLDRYWEDDTDLESYFKGLRYVKCDGLSKYGKPKNIYTENYADDEELRVYLPRPEEVLRENTDIEFTFAFADSSDKDRRKVYDDFVDWITGYKIKYHDTCRNKELQMILLEAIEPSEDYLYGDKPFIVAEFKFKNLFGKTDSVST